MSVTTSTSADRNGEAWGLRAQDWSEVETQQRPTYEEAVRRAGIGPGQTVLDAARRRRGAHARPLVRPHLGLRVRRRGRARAGDDVGRRFRAILGADQQDAARDGILEPLAVCRTPGGGYRLQNEWHYLIARA
jgi:hypothetical protein